MNKIHIDYAALQSPSADDPKISDEILTKAKGWFGGKARAQLIRLFDRDIRLLAVEIAHRQGDPVKLYEAGSQGVLDALDLYQVGATPQSFRAFALPIIRQHVRQARDHRG